MQEEILDSCSFDLAQDRFRRNDKRRLLRCARNDGNWGALRQAQCKRAHSAVRHFDWFDGLTTGELSAGQAQGRRGRGYWSSVSSSSSGASSSSSSVSSSSGASSSALGAGFLLGAALAFGADSVFAADSALGGPD
jgi:hypothetical protein